MSVVPSESPSNAEVFGPDGKPIPPSLQRATLRLEFPPSYVLVGVYRLFTDKTLYVPAWDKCKHATQRGLTVSAAWMVMTFAVQRKFVAFFLINSKKVTVHSGEKIFGYENPFDLPTYATLLFFSSQITYILAFFLRRNISIARERAWAHTVASRGKGPDFWQPYVEEREFPPFVDPQSSGGIERWLGSYLGRLVFRRIILLPFALNPLVHSLLSAGLKSLGTARYLHRPYFEAKKMTPQQKAVFIEERKWDYRLFGFAAALLEGLPIIGLIFTISNRVGAAMWAHDLEKRQHAVAAQRLHSVEK